MTNRALLLINRHARQGHEKLDAAVDELKKLDFDLVEESTRHPSKIGDIIRRHKDKVDLVIVGGGDGTLNAASDALVETGLPLGVLPLGTANDLARTLGLPLDLIQACDVIKQGNLREIDLGWVNGKHFFNVSNMGLPIKVTEQLTSEFKKRWGAFAYLLTTLKVLKHARPFHATIKTPTQVLMVKTIQISVGNGRHYGGGLTVSENAEIDDQRLDLYCVEIGHWWQMLWIMPRMRSGKHERSNLVNVLKGQEIEITTRHPRKISTDGEITTRTPAVYKVVPLALKVYVPTPPEKKSTPEAT